MAWREQCVLCWGPWGQALASQQQDGSQVQPQAPQLCPLPRGAPQLLAWANEGRALRGELPCLRRRPVWSRVLARTLPSGGRGWGRPGGHAGSCILSQVGALGVNQDPHEPAAAGTGWEGPRQGDRRRWHSELRPRPGSCRPFL